MEATLENRCASAAWTGPDMRIDRGTTLICGVTVRNPRGSHLTKFRHPEKGALCKTETMSMAIIRR